MRIIGSVPASNASAEVTGSIGRPAGVRRSRTDHRFREDGLYTFVRWHTFFTNPPLTVTEAELREAFAIIDTALEITDRAVVGA